MGRLFECFLALLDVLFFIRNHAYKSWSSELIAHELRSSSNSVSTRLDTLKSIDLIDHDPQDLNLYRYKTGDADTETTLNEITEIYKVKKQKVLELIFSPLKKGRHFANAFLVKPVRVEKDEEDSDG